MARQVVSASVRPAEEAGDGVWLVSGNVGKQVVRRLSVGVVCRTKGRLAAVSFV